MEWKEFNKKQQEGKKILSKKLEKYMTSDNGLTDEEKVQEVLTKGHKCLNRI